MNLNDTISILDDSLVTSKRGLIRTKDGKVQQQQSLKFPEIENMMDYDMSLTMNSNEFRKFFDNTMESSLRYSTTNLSETFSTKQKTDQLYSQFLEVLQSRSNDIEVFETVQDLIQTCTDTIDNLIDNGKRLNDKYKLGEDMWLLHERNTWRLLYCLYKDRLMNQKELMDSDELAIIGSEKQIVEQLYSSKANLI